MPSSILAVDTSKDTVSNSGLLAMPQSPIRKTLRRRNGNVRFYRRFFSANESDRYEQELQQGTRIA